MFIPGGFCLLLPIFFLNNLTTDLLLSGYAYFRAGIQRARWILFTKILVTLFGLFTYAVILARLAHLVLKKPDIVQYCFVHAICLRYPEFFAQP